MAEPEPARRRPTLELIARVYPPLAYSVASVVSVVVVIVIGPAIRDGGRELSGAIRDATGALRQVAVHSAAAHGASVEARDACRSAEKKVDALTATIEKMDAKGARR